METYHVTATVADDGTITIEALPFRAGEQVEVIVRSHDGESVSSTRYPLRGKPVYYEEPFAAASKGDWDALQRSSSTHTSGSGGCTGMSD